MDTFFIFQLLIFIVVIVQIILLIFFRANRKDNPQQQVLNKFTEYEKRFDKNEITLRDEFGRNRDETSKSAKDTREELALTLKMNREELLNHLTLSLKNFEEKFSGRIDSLTRETGTVFEKNRETIEKKLSEIQENNSKKLEEMRKTVDEKLHDALEKRLTESFKQVRDNLDKVLLGLGEMQNLAAGVGDLKKVLTNVKTKGVLGEYQLAAILEQLLTPAQYAENVKTKTDSRENVEFAVRIPSKEDSDRPVWLPIDSKFPTADYENLMAAYESADVQEIERAKKELESRIKKSAKEIQEKYIEPPNTTEFAIMFLPFEGLYAEVLRIPGLFESMQAEYKITIAGPTTISAFLNSLQMGFRSLAVEKRTSEIWGLLGAVKTQFGKFADVLEAAKRKLDSASEELAKTGTRSRQIEKRLKDVQSLPEPDSQKLLGNLDLDIEDDEQ